MNKTVLRSHHRNGLLYQQAPQLDGGSHGLVLSWHRNGKPAARHPYQLGLLHGVCRQWRDDGKLLGEYKMVRGTGMQYAWHDNGRLSMGFFTLEGRFYGRSRMWLDDGTLISDRLYLNNAEVTPRKYRQAKARNPRLPRFEGRLMKIDANHPRLERHKFNLLAARFLTKSPVEARTWLAAEDGRRRSLGSFRIARHALKSNAGKFVEALYQAGAGEVLVPDIYFSKNGDHYADSLLVSLPGNKAKRAAIRRICNQMMAGRTGTFLPETDFGQPYLYILPG